MNSTAVHESRIGLMIPNDLIEYIWSFNYFWAAHIIQKYTQKYIQFKVKELSEMIAFATFNSRFSMREECLVQYKLFYRNRIMDRQQIFNVMKSCQCCNRHQKNKPVVLKHWTDTIDPWNQTGHCSCTCRHISRMICRSVDE